MNGKQMSKFKYLKRMINSQKLNERNKKSSRKYYKPYTCNFKDILYIFTDKIILDSIIYPRYSYSGILPGDFDGDIIKYIK